VQNSQLKCFDSFRQGIEWVYQDSNGSLWAGGSDGLWRWQPGPPQHLDTSRIASAIEDESGNLLLVEENGLKRFSDGKAEDYILPGFDWHTPVRAFRSSDGSLWVGTAGRGLIHVHRGRVDLFATSDGLSGNFVLSIFEIARAMSG